MVRPEVIFAAVYAAFLVAVSQLLRRSARRITLAADGDHALPAQGMLGATKDPSWAHGLAARFRWGLAAAVLAVAAFILLSAAWRFHDPAEVLLLLCVGAGVLWSSAALVRYN